MNTKGQNWKGHLVQEQSLAKDKRRKKKQKTKYKNSKENQAQQPSLSKD